MGICSKNNLLTKRLQCVSIACPVFTLIIVASNTHHASANVFSRLWKNFKVSASKLTLFSESSSKNFSLSDFINKNSNKRNWRKPFTKAKNFFQNGKSNTSSKIFEEVQEDGSIVTVLKPGNEPYISPRNRRLGSLVNYDPDSDSNGSTDITTNNKPIISRSSTFNEDFITSDGGVGKVLILKTNGKTERSESLIKNLDESKQSVNNFETISTGLGVRSTFNPNKEAIGRTNRREVIRTILKARKRN